MLEVPPVPPVPPTPPAPDVPLLPPELPPAPPLDRGGITVVSEQPPTRASTEHKKPNRSILPRLARTASGASSRAGDRPFLGKDRLRPVMPSHDGACATLDVLSAGRG